MSNEIKHFQLHNACNILPYQLLHILDTITKLDLIKAFLYLCDIVRNIHISCDVGIQFIVSMINLVFHLLKLLNISQSFRNIKMLEYVNDKLVLAFL